TVTDGKVYVKLAYTNSMIGDISQALDGENYTVLEVSTDDEGYNYVLVELDGVDDIENVQLVVNTPIGSMTHIIRIVIDTDTLAAVEAETYSFGSAQIELEAGEYDIDVSLKNAANTSNDSMAASCIKSAVLTVNSDGTAQLTVNLQAVTVGTISGWATEWKIYQGSSASGDTVDADITGTDEDGNVTQITFDIPDNSADGVYVNMFIGAINAAQNAYIAIDYSSLTEESTVKTYTGTAHIDQFGSYDVTVTVTVTDGYITSITVEGSNFSGTYAETNQAKLQTAAEGISASVTGLSATDADAINGVDAVSGATYSSNAIKNAILDALSLVIEDETINLPTEELAEGEYTVEIAFYTDTVSHSLVENDTITAVINVDSEGNVSLTTDIINGTETEPLYVTEFNGYYENNDTSGSLITEGTAAEKSDTDYSDSYFSDDTQVVSQVTFPLTGDYAAYYYTNFTIYVPAMNNLTGELEGLYFENGYFDAVTIAKIYWDSLTAVSQSKTEVSDGSYTADISILKSDSDETSSAGSYFTTTDVPITVTDGKVYVKLAYTNSMIGDISQALDGENYTVLEVSTDDEGYNYVLVELDSIDDVENVQLVVNTPVGTMTHIVRIAVDGDTLKKYVADGDYTADISILKSDSDEISSAGSYFTTTDVPITVTDGKVYVKLAYTNSMIGDISQALDGENYTVLEVSTDDEGYNYVLVELDSIDDVENVQLVVNTPVGTMTHIVRIVIDTDTLTEVQEDKGDDGDDEDSEAVVYSVPVVMMSEVNQGSTSMGNDALDGNAIVTVKDGKSTVRLTVKAVYYAGLYGHLTKLWSYPSADSMNYDWWNNSTYEISADIAEYFTDYGLNYTTGDETTYEFPRVFTMERDSEKEDVIYIRISSDAMEGFDQAARLELDWANAVVVEDAETEIQVESPEITVSDSSPTNNQTVTVKITAEDGAEIYYTTDGSVPSESSNLYGGEFTVTGTSETVTIYAVAVKDGVSSAVSSTDIRFTASSSSSSSDSEIEDGKYWMDIYLWNANLDQASMGDSAFDNNRQALVTVSNNGTSAKVQIATNPVSVSGYTSALQGIKSSEVSISVDDTDKFTTNTRYDGTEHTFSYVTLFSFTTTDLESEYIPVEISVPYTPMDGITENDGGYIAARLKLSWNNMTAADSSATLTQNSTTASGSSSSSGSSGSLTSYTSDTTGIKIKADAYIFDDDVTFTAEAVSDGSDYETAESLINGGFTLYSISAEDANGSEVSPSGTAEVYIPVIEAYGENVVIYRVVSEDNSEAYLTELEYEISEDGEYYVLTVKEFGLFAVVPTDEAEEIAEEIEDVEEEAEADGQLFDDIEGHWAEEYIIRAAEMGLFNGVDENSFGPDIATTRAMFVTVLGRLKGIDTNKSYEMSFNDVNSDDYFYSYVGYAAANDIVKGMDEDTFAPYANITREQMALILCKFAENEGIELKAVYSADFTDSDKISSWAQESVNALAAAGIINGRTDGSFDPKGEATRAEIAVMLLRFIDEYM
ncbi:MAG: NEAT domain-containing protein, partial [Clostridiales bacterium]|nr:NEAT domain-containing protein [Clostridiales bacterium]